MALLDRRVARMRDRVAQQFVEQADGGDRQQAGQNEEHVAPAEIVAEHAARRLAEHLAENLPRQECAEHLLAPFVRNDVADEGHGEGNDPASGKPAGEAGRDQGRQVRRQSAGDHHQCGEGGGDADAEIFAEAVADRADDELHRTVRQQVKVTITRGRADGGLQIVGDLRQQRVGRAHHRLGGESRAGEQDDSAGGIAARGD